jgi:hypothetical protein
LFSDGTEGFGFALLFGVALDPEGLVVLPDMKLPLGLVFPEVEPDEPVEELPL